MSAALQREFPKTIEERIDEIEAARNELIAATIALDAAKAEARPAPDRWSVSEILYHLYMAETRVTERLAALLSAPERKERPNETELKAEWERIVKTVLNREPRITAPAPIQPARIPSLAQAIQSLKESREALLKVIRAHSEDDLASIGFPHPLPTVGMFSGLGWLSIAACHDSRHLEQISEIV